MDHITLSKHTLARWKEQCWFSRAGGEQSLTEITNFPWGDQLVLAFSLLDPASQA